MTNRIYGKSAPIPAPNGYSILFDSTQYESSLAGKLPPTSLAPSPGANRGMVAGKGLIYGIMPFDGPITVYSAVLRDDTWDVILKHTMPANDWQSFYFVPEYYGSQDAIIYIKSGDVMLHNLITIFALETL